MKAEKVKVSKVKTNPDNPRLIKDRKFRKLVKSIKEFPEMLKLRPIVVDENNIILGGNMRYKACIEAGLKEIYIIQAKDLNEDQKKEFIIKDNVGFGEWDWDIIANDWDLGKLNDWGLDLPEFNTPLDAEQDDYEEPEDIEVDVVLGDLIEIGDHRLLCGDSTDSDLLDKLMNNKKTQIVFTDPPYNVSYGKHKNPRYKTREILNDSMSTNDFKNFLNDIFSNMALVSDKGCMVYICMSAQEWGNTMLALKDNNYHWSSTIIWVKDQLVLSRKDYHTQYEPLWYGWLGDDSRICKLDDRKQSDVWEIPRPKRSELHPTTKPIELVSRALKNSSKEKNIVLDLFLGSGSTMVAAHQLNRKCYGMELDPRYCQVIMDRMKQLDSNIKIKINGKKYDK
jgi:DNA modification methylase|tara:strand:- start:1686 stop:2870 length:1185 start_codon:yes stop_codon:yes gene_type:complete